MADHSKKIWNYLIKVIGNEFGVAGLMGNLEAESGLNSINLENAYEKKLGYTDKSYTAAVDDNTYDNFVKDAAGYGLAQWTYYTRKQALLDFAKTKKKSIGNLDMQLDFLAQELNSKYKGVLNVLKSASSVKIASDCVLKDFENPKNQDESVKEYRASLGDKWYNKYATKATEAIPEAEQKEDVKPEPKPEPKEEVGKVDLYRVTTPKGLNIRKGPGTSFDRTGCLTYKTIVGVNKREGNWGYVPARKGWICLDYTETC